MRGLFQIGHFSRCLPCVVHDATLGQNVAVPVAKRYCEAGNSPVELFCFLHSRPNIAIDLPIVFVV